MADEIPISGLPAGSAVELADLFPSVQGAVTVKVTGSQLNTFVNENIVTPALGGALYSSSTGVAILAPTNAANRPLMSGNLAAPSWSTATYPATTTINQLLYSSSNNTVAGLTTLGTSVLVTDSGGVPSLATSLPSVVQGNITSVGTVTSGTWHATAIGTLYGGTGQTTYIDGQLLVGLTAGNTLRKGGLLQGTGISISFDNTSGNFTITNTGILTLCSITNISVSNSPYTVISTDCYLSVDTSGGAVTILMPNSTVDARQIFVKDATGNSLTNNITVTSVGGATTFDGQTSFIINSNTGGASFVYNLTRTHYEVN